MDVSSKFRLGADNAANAEYGPVTDDRLLVLIGSSEYDLDLIYAGKRLAEALQAGWTVVSVQTSALRLLPDRDRDRRLEIVRIAESLGAEAVTLHGASSAQRIAKFARLRRASKILVGSPAKFGWHALRHFARITALKQLAQGVEIIAIAANCQTFRVSHHLVEGKRIPSRPALHLRVGHYLCGVAVTAICTAVAYPFGGHVNLINIVMIYTLGAALAGLFLGRGPAAITSVANILAFDFFFVPPIFSLEVWDPNYIVTFGVMLLVSLIVANLMIAVRERTEEAGEREHYTAALYAVTRDLSVSGDSATMIKTAQRHLKEVLQAEATVLLCNDKGQLAESGHFLQNDQRLSVDLTVARWVATRRERAGNGTPQFPAARARYLPLSGSHIAIGVLVAERADTNLLLLAEQQRLLEAIADQLALALERTRLADQAHAAHLAAERAALRNTLLASISHDLRTPLSAIAGAGSMVAQHDFSLDLYRRVTLGKLIEDKAREMSDLLTNVLELVRLESGADVLNRDWHSLSDLVGLAIARHESRLTGWQVSTDISNDLPLLSVDSNLLVQLLSNLLENAIKYTPPGTRIHISALHHGSIAELVVEDTGPGLDMDIAEELFEKFTRGRTESTVGGVGLGLAICRAVARLHGGEVRATSSSIGGARFEVTLPLIEEPPVLEAPASVA